MADQPQITDELLQGAVDCYVHATPDLLPRRVDDIELARESAAAGFAAVVHRHQFSATAERAQLAAAATGFRLIGAILLNDSVGGLHPPAVDLALRMGAGWVGLPTLSARAFRAARASGPPTPFDAIIGFGPGQLIVADDDGMVLPEVADVVDLVEAADVPLNLGYVSAAEMLAVARHVAGRVRLVLTNAHMIGDALGALLEFDNVFVEVTSYGIHPEGLGGSASTKGVDRNVDLMRRVGSDRLILSSDGGMSGSPTPAEILRWAIGQYIEAGITQAELRTMLHETPRRVLGVDW